MASGADGSASSPETNPKRPSFGSFWKRSKEAAAAAGTRNLTFVLNNKTAKPTTSGSEAEAETEALQSAKDKAQLRRQQVRRAQIEHRKRKATYVKRLEDDVADTRNNIAEAEEERNRLRRENAAIKARLALAGISPLPLGTSISSSGNGTSPPAIVAPAQPPLQQLLLPQQFPLEQTRQQQPQQDQQQQQQFLQPPLPQLSHSSGSPVSPFDDLEDLEDIELEDVTVVLAMDEITGQPTYRIVSSSEGSSMGPSPLPEPLSSPPQLAVVQPVVPAPAPASTPTTPSHAPAAEALAPAEAAPVHDGICGLDREQTHQAINFILALEHPCWDHFRPSDFDLAMPLPGVLETGPFTNSGHTLMASSLALRRAPEHVFEDMWVNKMPGGIVRRASKPAPHLLDGSTSWAASGLTLRSLRGLADALNPSADKEVAPVQAWFELAARFPPELLLRGDVLHTLRREFEGIVKCLHFGAVMERGAFESVVERVMGAAVAGMGAPDVMMALDEEGDEAMGDGVDDGDDRRTITPAHLSPVAPVPY